EQNMVEKVQEDDKVNKKNINQHTPKESNELESSGTTSQGSVTGVNKGSRNINITEETRNNSIVIWEPSEELNMGTTEQEEKMEGSAVSSNEQMLDFENNKKGGCRVTRPADS
ncbi:hypothetical protein HAX54_041996, partial [Datura stramonium]|nr:hypothetical protein [Datura stramonium]